MLMTLLDTAVAMDPARVVLADGGPVTLSGLRDRARALSGHLDGHDACVLLAQNGPVLPITTFACAAAGVPVVPLNYRLPDSPLSTMVSTFDRPCVVSDPDQADRLPTTWETSEWLAASRAAPQEPLGYADGETHAAVLFTSGTTSAPKAVPLTHDNLTSYLLNTVELLGASSDDAALISVPPYHVAALGSALSTMLAGRRAVYLPRFDAAAWLRLVETERISSAMVVPTMLARILDVLGTRTLAPTSLRQLAYGGARMSPTLLRRALEALPETGFTNAYGLTETSSTLTVLSPEDHRAAAASDDAVVARRLGSVGRPVPGVEIQIRDENGSVLPAGTPGMLWVRGAQVSGRYLGDGSVLDDDGWFCTRDGAEVDGDDYLYIVGRWDDTIIRGGENVAPAEVEDVLTAHPGISDAAVFGRPDEEWGERIVAAVVPVPGAAPTEDQVRSWARERLRSSRTPDDVVFVVDLPYGPTGKLLRRELADTVEAAGGRSADRTTIETANRTDRVPKRQEGITAP